MSYNTKDHSKYTNVMQNSKFHSPRVMGNNPHILKIYFLVLIQHVNYDIIEHENFLNKIPLIIQQEINSQMQFKYAMPNSTFPLML